MDRNKLLAIVIGGVAALGAVAFLAGNAQAASWHDYTGDIYAGHAYGLVVPANARSYEIALSGEGNETARISVFGPDGAKLGFYSLSHDLPSAAIVGPADGRHVIYVYDLSDGALKLRVDSQTAPPADLQKIDLARQDVAIGDSSSPQKFDKVFTTKLSEPPVFATLLYDGSVQGLDATVASAKGDVVRISHESGTAFSPGVWSSLSGERTSLPENLDGTSYTVTVHAQKFEGSMVLTTLGLDLKAPPAPPTAPHHVPAKVSTTTPTLPTGALLLPVAKPVAFSAQKGALVLQDPKADQAQDKRNDSYNGSYNGSSYWSDAISIYAPDDSLLKYVTLDSRHPNATLDLPATGEYVAYVHASTNKGVVAYAPSTSSALTGMRELQLRKETFNFEVSGGSIAGPSETKPFQLAHVPVALHLAVSPDATSVLGMATIHNDGGVVAEASSLAQAPGVDFLTWSYQDPSHFAAGDHALDVNGILEGKLTLTAISYVRFENADPTATPPADANAPSGGGLGDVLPIGDVPMPL